ncbi:glutamate--cysteine ligase [Wolbachia endosymbiont of Howardula sp.]|uniref:glutamate--cysteine ligase n=1 Tax=Wolbachia endosymbiont of Howardula sp. TaxID=2916816 RepID=UPI00217D53C7|nr:glutamate--cysteine ligase [Wolbachia endosymbiont of Howardula sp.]UWI83288.1 glutamate--cysteine ligase [Wolbachia endosymbiont of Howardula sp.]
MQNIILPILEKSINSWFENKFHNLILPLYSSIDLRYSGYKIAPVDANLFPAGFNNLNQSSKIIASHFMKIYFKKTKYTKALIIPEKYTRNQPYIANVFAIADILELAGLHTKIGMLYEENSSPSCYESVIRDNHTLKTTSGFIPDVIILNFDMTSHIPNILHNITQKILPDPLYGWHRRKKFKYFAIYQDLVYEFCQEFKIDPWLISIFTSECNNIDFSDDISLQEISHKVDDMLYIMQEKYKEHNVTTQPYVFIKASNGTYGMGIITARNSKEIFSLNKKKRNNMKKVKEGVKINSVIIQEGIPSLDIFQDMTAEPLIYYIAKDPICYLYRCNNRKDKFSSLNAIDCEFYDVSSNVNDNILLLWKVISKLSILALSLEITSESSY